MEQLRPGGIDAALERAVALGEVGVQVAAYHGDELIVDAWIGLADADSGRPVMSSTLFPIFSETKALAVAAVHLQADRGLIDLAAPVADVWPEFGQAGKATIRICDVLTHRSGVPHVPPGTGIAEMRDWDTMCTGIAALAPMYPPGTRSTYQARNMGWILGELVRRTDDRRRPFSQFLRDELLDPLGMDDTWVGLPESQEPRLARLVGEYAGPSPAAAAPSRAAAYGPLTAPQIYASRELRAACLPASGAITTARSMARFWAMLAGAGSWQRRRYLDESTVRSFSEPRERPDEFDEILGLVPLIGRGGFWIGGPYPRGEAGVGVGPNVICQPGAGGSIGWADLDRRLAVTVCHNVMTPNVPPRPASRHFMTMLGDAVRALVD